MISIDFADICSLFTRVSHILRLLLRCLNANGILNVRAEDKGTKKSEKITITNDNGRLSQEEIDRMVKEDEEFAEEKKKIKEIIDARNNLENV